MAEEIAASEDTTDGTVSKEGVVNGASVANKERRVPEASVVNKASLVPQDRTAHWELLESPATWDLLDLKAPSDAPGKMARWDRLASREREDKLERTVITVKLD